MRRRLSIRPTVLPVLAAIGCLVARDATADVRSCTIGIDINCPSGLSE